jgi:uncharacterized protein YbcC (UPF0753/DUF2309 family)
VELNKIKVPFTKEYLQQCKDKVKNWPFYKETWEKTLEEIKEYDNPVDKANGRGKIEIISEEEVMAMGEGLITPRFGILQGEKVRPIDDYRELNR